MHEEMTKKIKNIKKGDSFLVTVTVRDQKTNNLKTSLYMDEFIFADLEGTREVIEGLIEDIK